MAKTIARFELLPTTTVAQNSTVYTQSCQYDYNSGYAAVLFSSTAGSITVTQQVSKDNKFWYNPVDNTNTAVGVIATAAGVTTGRWVAYSPVLAPYVRFRIVENNVAATDVALSLVFQEDIM
jgi:hypothetical protein